VDAAAPRAGSPPARVDVLGVRVSAIDVPAALAALDGWVERGERHYVCVSGVHGVMESLRDPALRQIHNAAGLVTPDGMPLVWLGRLAGQAHVRRVYGPDLMLAYCAHGLARGRRHFFYGGGEGVAERLVGRLRARFPGLAVAGTYTPPFRALTAEEDAAVVRRINDAAPDVVWVGLSTPKQERWMAAHRAALGAAALVGVGAAFDFNAGLKRQAPAWMQRAGLEWAFRLATEPRRLGRRYLVNNPLFVWHVAQQLLGRRRYDGGGTPAAAARPPAREHAS
jgi:N-acetylglucosaminyldiphosphoundecaprenol N-acetyl-beta-D-mannosaminyltransferase